MDILSREQLEPLMNSGAKDELKRAVKLLFKKGDIVEVRAWNKQHEVFTGRYEYGKKLVDVLNLFDGEGECDVYYVLNPVGNKHGLRMMQAGGLCTWEPDMPWRRRFLLDFDPRRENKIATNEQWLDAYNTAVRAMTWLDSYGFKGIVLASSGNGCHLLVPCNLPNDAPSKELVRKVQRAVSEKFSTATVECECFPDANRLVRAYGSTNKKGSESEDMHYRLSGILAMPEETDDDPKAIMEQIIKHNPIADAKAHNLGSGAGPFNRDLLYTRLEAWQEGWEGDNTDDEFVFEETDRRDGFRILCPGNLSSGWPDGEQHDDAGTSLNDSSIVYIENGWPRFSCRHNHCGVGAAHGKKTWKDLQDFYDKDRRLHRIVSEDFFDKWNLEFVDDGVEDKGTVDVDKLLADDEMLTVEVQDVNPVLPAGKLVSATVDAPFPVTIVSDTAPAEGTVRKRLSDMPESAMYGWLGQAARELETPLGFAYPAILTAFAANIQVYPKHIRPTLYTCLIGPVHCGKSETIKRATQYLHFKEPDTVKWTVPGSDRGLLKIFGDKKKDDKEKKEDAVGFEIPKARLLAQDELRNTIAKANIQGSSLPATLCSLWSQDEAGAADKTGEHTAMVRLNILGALKADDAEDFAEVFGKDSTAGLYDRFVYGIASKGWKYNIWEREMQFQSPKGCTVPAYCYEMVNEWRDAEPVGRGRLAEIALRVAYITASANHDTEVTIEAVKAALEFCEWQEFIRAGYKAGMGDSVDALCTNAILTVLEKLEPGVWIKWKTIAGAKNWYRKFGSRVLSATRDALFKSGHTIEETIEDEDGRPKRTGRLRLRVDSD